VWRQHARSTDVGAAWAALVAAGVGVHVRGDAGYPPALTSDHEAPGVVFSRGDVAAIDGRRVAIVGSRDCTRYGREIAFSLGRDLAAAGVGVVSGLALGVDGAAHAGALKAAGAPAVAVVGSGLDVVYPRRNAHLWRDVAATGVVLSEAPLGAAPEPWRFPVRNRIIAALAEVVVVVESRHRGGSRHTVEAAMARDRPVLAVPGPVRSPASELPNALLAEGCHPARDVVDVLVALNLATPVRASGPAVGADPRPPPDAAGQGVLDALGWQPATFEQLVVATGRAPGEVGVALAHLERDGWVVGSGGWWERGGEALPTG
ncbi:MAG: DNA-processing protein DprA, partial [Acidimicrobiales bacterium]